VYEREVLIMLNQTRLSLVCVAGLALTNLVSMNAWSAQDPATAPIPDLTEIGTDPRRALVLEIVVNADGTAALIDVLVSDVPPGATDDDPPLLQLMAFDEAGNVLVSRYAWDPRWEYVHSEQGEEEVLPTDPGTSGIFDFAFDHRFRSVRLYDLQLDPAVELAEFDVSGAVEAFCTAQPNDPNCDGFNGQDVDADGIPDQEDNCPITPNADQSDFDMDGFGDVCDGDIDGDQVANVADACGLTKSGALVDSNGCSIDQLCPCGGPKESASAWRNKGEYVSCHAKVTANFVEAGLITGSEKGALQSTAARNECGRTE
jgi:hypothetical protein